MGPLAKGGEMHQEAAGSISAPGHPNLVLTDLYWLKSRDRFLLELTLLSLLYENIFIQDEYLVLSSRLAQWFGGRDFDMLRPFFDIGVLKILTPSPGAYEQYPDAEPMAARSRELQAVRTGFRPE